MNFLQLCQAVRSESGVSGALSSVKNQTGMLLRIVNWVADSYQQIQAMNDWRFLWRRETAALQPGQGRYTAAALGVPALGRILAQRVVLTGPAGGVIQRLLWRPYEVIDALPAASGPPRFFTRHPDDSLSVYPVPDAACGLRLEHLRQPHALVENTDEPIIPEEALQKIIVWDALRFYGRHAEDMAAQVAAREGYDRLWPLLCDRHAASITAPPATMVAVAGAEPVYA